MWSIRLSVFFVIGQYDYCEFGFTQAFGQYLKIGCPKCALESAQMNINFYKATVKNKHFYLKIGLGY